MLFRSQSTYSAGPDDTRAALDLLARGQIDVDSVVSHRMPFERADEAYRMAETGQALKVVVEAFEGSV